MTNIVAVARKIPLSRNRVAVVDDVDYDDLARFRWYANIQSRSVYAYRSVRLPDGRWTTAYMHRHILGLEPGDPTEVDHVNGDGLDNRRENLRPVTRAENQLNRRGLDQRNTSGFTGVSWSLKNQRWEARIKINGCRYFAGYHDTAESASAARDALGRKIYTALANQAVS